MLTRFAALAALSAVALTAQVSSAPGISPSSPSNVNEDSASPAKSVVPELQPDPNDPMVLRAKADLERIQQLVTEGALPRLRLEKAQEDVQEALDMSILNSNIYKKDILAEQADQMVAVAERIVLRRQRAMARMEQLVESGVISRAEAQASGADLDRARIELNLAISRANAVRGLAEAAKLEKSIATLETQAEAHPEWSGRIYTKYDGDGVFSASDRQKVENAFMAKFFKPLPITADGETAVHRALGFDHRGRIDVGVTPDSPEGEWLMGYLERNHIPFFAFRAAVPHRATGAHIHIGPQSTKLATSARNHGGGVPARNHSAAAIGE